MDLIDYKYWSNLSMDGQVCGMVGCKGDPTSKCPHCNHFYCYEHIKIHLDTNVDDKKEINKNGL